MEAVRTYWTSTLGASVQYYDVAGTRTRALHAGDGEVVLMLHGMGGHLENFVFNVMPLAEMSGRHVYALDLLGHGMNGRPDRSYTFEDMVNHILQFADVIGARKFTVVGLSLGGLVGSWLAIRQPERISKLCLTTTFGFHLKGTPDADVDTSFLRIKESNLKVLRTPTLDAVRERLRPLAHNPKAISEEMVAVRHHVYNQPGAEAAIAKFVESFHEQRWDYVLTEERLAKIPVETLVIWGEHNHPDPEYARRATAVIPKAKLHVCAGSGHWPHVEADEDYNKVLSAFLRT